MAPELTEGAKFDADKPPLSLLDPLWLLGTAQVLDFGARKYEPYNWKKGILYSRVLSAALRHMFAWQDGEDCDEETGLHHLLHASCCLMFLSHYELTGMHFRQFDDRSGTEIKDTGCAFCSLKVNGDDYRKMNVQGVEIKLCKDVTGCRRRQDAQANRSSA